MYQLRMIMI